MTNNTMKAPYWERLTTGLKRALREGLHEGAILGVILFVTFLFFTGLSSICYYYYPEDMVRIWNFMREHESSFGIWGGLITTTTFVFIFLTEKLYPKKKGETKDAQ